MHSQLPIVLALACLASACGSNAEEPEQPAPAAASDTKDVTPPEAPSPAERQHQRVPQPAESALTPGQDADLPEETRERIVADAAKRAGVAETSVEVGTLQAVQWPDGSLGCPQPGVMYTQMIVPGYRVVVKAGGKTYDYRATQRGDFQVCQSRIGELQPPPLRSDPAH